MFAKNDKIAEEYDRKRIELQQKQNSVETIQYQPLKSVIQDTQIDTKQVVNNQGDDYINLISQPQLDESYDLLPMPSGGKIYPSRKKAFKVSYMNTTDENILTSQNLVQSGKFLEILINRKLLEMDIRYRDLHPGDRNAIMIWLRATAYGEMYPIQLISPSGKMFSHEFDLSSLKTIPLTVEPDKDGLFNFIMPTSGDNIRFKFLSCGDLDDIEIQLEEDIVNGILESRENTYKLNRMIKEINGNNDVEYINNYVKKLRTMDSREFKKYVDSIEPGVDLKIKVEAPGGESVETFLPLAFNFFWPDSGL
jgi:hypothetical protein